MFGDSDYIVEEFIKPNKIAVPLINDERADILGNFDDDDDKFTKKKTKTKKKNVVIESEENPFADGDDVSGNENGNDDDNENENKSEIESDGNDDDGDGNKEIDDEMSGGNVSSDGTTESASIPEKKSKPEIKSKEKKDKKKLNKKVKQADTTTKKLEKKVELSDNQMKSLIRGSSKQDRFVLYVTNLNYSTTRDILTEFFSTAGPVKSVRIPKVRRSAFAFVEMADLNSLKNALALHNKTLDNYTIKVQISEGGKKKSANKKNILKQKNRKLAEMRNEGKAFQRSGKGYDKTIKKEINQQKIQQNRRLAKKAAKKQK